MTPQLGIRSLTDKLVSHALTLGHFTSVSAHEPKSAPTGIHAAVWVQEIRPSTWSGLNSTAVLLVFMLRGYAPMIQEPQDEIDPVLVDAIDSLMVAYSGDFTLDGSVVAVDLLGFTGTSLSARAGYAEIDRTMYRILDLTIPLIVDAVFEQSP